MTNAMFGANKFKLGVFCVNTDGAMTLTTVPERWPAQWDEIVEVSQMIDAAGFEFYLPLARWKGYGGEQNIRLHMVAAHLFLIFLILQKIHLIYQYLTFRLTLKLL